jgi:3-deoxy-D-manno-octulosonic-acid transferase
MFAWLLNVAYLALLAALAPWLAMKSLTQGKYRHGWGQKFWGAVPRRTGDGRCLWLHAVSVGEVLQLKSTIEALARHQPDLEFVISVTTSTGYDVARQCYPRHQVIYYPLDFSWAVRRALARLRPSAIVLVELELWPNFLFAAADLGIPVTLINGRITERSYRGYRRIRPLVQAMLERVRRILVQNDTYAARFADLGADRNRISVVGSIKFDGVQTDRANSATRKLRQLFGLQAGERVFLAGSTQPPEEQFALDAWLAAREAHPALRLILVPRHKERFDEVARLVSETYQLPLVRRSRIAPESADTEATGASTPPADRSAPVLLLDTLGELSACWGLADIAFVGGSLTRRGGQNMIEPAGYGAAVMFGPNTWNFKDAVELLLGQGGAVVVRDQAELTAKLGEFLADPESARSLGRQAQALVARQHGATGRTVDLILATLTEPRRARKGPDARAA